MTMTIYAEQQTNHLYVFSEMLLILYLQADCLIKQ